MGHWAAEEPVTAEAGETRVAVMGSCRVAAGGAVGLDPPGAYVS